MAALAAGGADDGAGAPTGSPHAAARAMSAEAPKVLAEVVVTVRMVAVLAGLT
jgi:hypothetical protein